MKEIIYKTIRYLCIAVILVGFINIVVSRHVLSYFIVIGTTILYSIIYTITENRKDYIRDYNRLTGEEENDNLKFLSDL